MLLVNLFFHLTVAFAGPGQMSISGPGCSGSPEIRAVAGKAERFSLPLKLKLEKKAGANLERKACNLRLPYSLKAGQKLQLWDLSQNVKLKGNNIRFSLNVSIVGKKNNILTLTETKYLTSPGLLVESECGRDVIVSANSDAVALGNGYASAATEDLELTLKTVPCK